MDIRTFFVIFSLASLFTLLFLLFYVYNSNRGNKLLKIYAWGKLLLTLSWLFLGLRGLIPVMLSIVFGNLFMFAGLAIEILVISSYNLSDIKSRIRLFSIAAAVSSLLFFAFMGQPENVRIFISSILNASIILIGVVFLFRESNKSRLHILMIYMYLFLSLVLLLRGTFSILIEKQTSLLTYNPIQSIAFISFLLVTYLGVISLLLLQKENDEKVLKAKANELDIANSKLTETIAAKNRFLSIIGHDLRGSIGNIAQMSDLLSNSSALLSEKNNQLLRENLFKSATTTFDLLENLLNWSKSQSGNITVNREIFELNRGVIQVMEHLQGLANEKQITITNKIDPAIKVMADQEMVQLILRNLLSNAIKFTPESGKITFEAARIKEAVKISVSDTGVGIPPDLQADLFSNNFNTTTTGTNSEKGSGLGLKLIKDFVELNQGTIEFESTPNVGSSFSFTLPLKE